jgi:hypothetical protein
MSDYLEHSNLKIAILEKLSVFVMNTQAGKTWQVIAHIENALNSTESDPICIIYTMNTLLNNKQFAHRLNHFKEIYGANSIVIFSSKESTNEYPHVKNINELNGILAHPKSEKRPRVVIMCSNPTRFADGCGDRGLIFNLDDNINQAKSHYNKIHIYFDELHNYINQIRTKIEKLILLDSVASIVGTTATPGQIWCDKKEWQSFPEIDLRSILMVDYAGVRDMSWRLADDHFDLETYRPGKAFSMKRDNDVVDFIKHILKNNNIISDGNYVFVPGGIRQSSHMEIRDIMLKINPDSVVIMINGKYKCVWFNKDGHMIQIPLAESGEVSDDIFDILKEYELEAHPKILTGHLCIGMGQTLTSERLGNFSHSILSSIDLNNDAIYQLFGRVTGRCKLWATYKKTIVFAPSITRDRCIAMEDCALNMMSSSGDGNVTADEYKQPMFDAINNGTITNGHHVLNNFIEPKTNKEKKPRVNEDDYERGFAVGTYEEIHKIALTMTKCNNLPKPTELDDKGCFRISGPGCQAKEKRAYSVDELRIHAYKEKIGSHLDMPLSKLKSGEYSKRRYLCYENLDDPASMKYCIIFVKKK